MRMHSDHKRVPVSVLIMLLLFLTGENLFCQNLKSDFGEMKGTLFTHTIIDKSDSLSSDIITELRDEKGLPLWFSRDFNLTVCLSGLCQMVRVKIYWTGAATYLGFQIPPNDPMTKTDHSKFTKDDYEKLDGILSDSTSLLKRFKIEELIIETENKNKSKNLIDAHSGATEPSLAGYVVKDAVFTCYTLWHAVYGFSMERIMSSLEQRADEDYLRLVFKNKKPQFILWAIDFIRKHPGYHQTFYPVILSYINSDDINLSRCALAYFTPVLLENAGLQNELITIMEKASLQTKFEILYKFSTLQKVNNEIIVNLLGQYEYQKLSTTMLGNICEMITAENLEDVRIRKMIRNISEDENQYVRNISQRTLQKIKN
jgi:hypothetical protein